MKIIGARLDFGKLPEATPKALLLMESADDLLAECQIEHASIRVPQAIQLHACLLETEELGLDPGFIAGVPDNPTPRIVNSYLKNCHFEGKCYAVECMFRTGVGNKGITL